MWFLWIHPPSPQRLKLLPASLLVEAEGDDNLLTCLTPQHAPLLPSPYPSHSHSHFCDCTHPCIDSIISLAHVDRTTDRPTDRQPTKTVDFLTEGHSNTQKRMYATIEDLDSTPNFAWQDMSQPQPQPVISPLVTPRWGYSRINQANSNKYARTHAQSFNRLIS